MARSKLKNIYSTWIKNLAILAGLFFAPWLVLATISDFDRVTADKLNVDNIQLDSNTISTSDSNGDLTLAPNGTGQVIINGQTASRVLYLDASNQVTSSPTVSATELEYIGSLGSALCGVDDVCRFTNKAINVSQNTFDGLTSGSVLFSGGSTIQQDNSVFYWDSTNDRLSIGSTDNTHVVSGSTFGEKLSVHAEGGTDLAEVAIRRHSDTAGFAPNVVFGRTRGTEAAETVLSASDSLGAIYFTGFDGTDFEIGASIAGSVNAAPGANDMPGALVFSTTPDGSATPAAVLTLTNDKRAIFTGLIDTAMSTAGPVISGADGALTSEAQLDISRGGTGQATANAALNALLPSQGGNSGEFLTTNGTDASWGTVAGSPLSVVSKTTTYTATTSDDVILVTAGASWTLTLYTAASNSGKILRVKRTDNDPSKIVTIDGNGAETIDGATTYGLYTQYEEVTLVSDGSNWHVLDHRSNTTPTSYTPTFQGFGTESSVNVTWQRIGSNMRVYGKATTGTVGASEIQISLPFSLTVSSDIASLRPVGLIHRDANVAYSSAVVIANGGNAYVNVGGFLQGGTAGGTWPLTAQAGSVIFNNSEVEAFWFDVPITGWKP